MAYLDSIELSRLLSDAAAMSKLSDVLELRVRYGETDQMGTFYNARALDWFECGRSELMRRRLGMSYAVMEERGVFLPLVEAHLEFQGGARYDDLLEVASVVEVFGRARSGRAKAASRWCGATPCTPSPIGRERLSARRPGLCRCWIQRQHLRLPEPACPFTVPSHN